MVDSIRVPTEVPKTKADHVPNADLMHEGSIRYYLEKTELAVLTEDQIGVIAFCSSLKKTGIQLTAVNAFFTARENSIKSMSSAINGVGRIQGKEVVTAGSWPMGMFATEKGGLIEWLKNVMPGRKPTGDQK